MSDIAIIAILVTVVTIIGLVGWATVQQRAMKWFWTALGIPAAISACLFAAASTASGWDGVTYMALLVFGSLPATAAVLLGGGIGLITRPKLPRPAYRV